MSAGKLNKDVKIFLQSAALWPTCGCVASCQSCFKETIGLLQHRSAFISFSTDKHEAPLSDLASPANASHTPQEEVFSRTKTLATELVCHFYAPHTSEFDESAASTRRRRAWGGAKLQVEAVHRLEFQLFGSPSSCYWKVSASDWRQICHLKSRLKDKRSFNC